MDRWWVLGVVLPLVLPGCVGSSPSDAASHQSSPSTPGTPGNLTGDALVWNETLAEPPPWRLGEWWKIRFQDEFTGAQYEAVRVVAGFEGDNYLVGMPTDAWHNALLILHIPGFGEVAKPDLSFEVHDVRFAPLKFPLTDGLEWDTAFEGFPIHAKATRTGPLTAEVTYVGDQYNMTATYDARQRELVKFRIDGYASYEVVDHGTTFDRLVTVPHGHDLVFQHGRFLGLFQNLDSPSTTISDTVNVGTTYDRVSFAVILGTVVPDLHSPHGYYSETVTAPNGTVWEHRATALDPAGLKIYFHQYDRPGGAWKLDHVAAGPGIAFTEGIAYHVYEVELPSGRIRASTGEHPHGNHTV